MANVLVMGGLDEPEALMLADTCLLWGHRLSEWCGHGPAIEEDIALTNTALDAIGQARGLYQSIAAVRGGDCTEDSLAYFRDADAFCNLGLAAADNGDYAQTILRSLYLSAWFVGIWESLCAHSSPTLRSFALESAKCARMSFRHAREWVIRFGDGTTESRERILRAVSTLAPFLAELTSTTVCRGDPLEQRTAWVDRIQRCFTEATLPPIQVVSSAVSTKAARAALLAEMQSVARAHPAARW